MVRKISLGALTLLLAAIPLIAQGYFAVEQGNVKVQVQPIVGTQKAEDFYGYDNTQFRATCPLGEQDAMVMFLYQDPSGQLYLFFINGSSPTAAGNMSAQLSISGIPAGADFVVKDDEPNMDPNDHYDIADGAANITWVWAAARGDGGVLGPLALDFTLTINPGILTGIQRIVFKYGDLQSPQTVELTTTDPITIKGLSNQPPVIGLTVTPASPHAREQVTFDASASYDPDGQIAEYDWDFDGDGVIDQRTQTPVVQHTYIDGGDYAVKLTVVDNAGISSTYTYQLSVATVTVQVTREISASTVLPGYSFRVTVRIHTNFDLVGAGLEEDIPAGWKITPVDNGGAIFKRQTVQWVFLNRIKAGSDRVITYDLTVPGADQLASIRLPQRYCITGIFQAKVPDFQVKVGGESCVMVDDCLPMLEAIAHLIPADPAMSGSKDKIDLRLSESISAAQLARAGELWRTEQAVVGTCGARIDLETLKRITAYAEACVPIDRPLPDMPTPQLDVKRYIIAPIPCQGVVIGFYDSQGNAVGNKFTVKVEITTDADAYGMGLDEDLPVGWRVTPIQNDGFLYRPDGNQWAYLGTMHAGETRTIIYQVEVPPSSDVGSPPAGCNAATAEYIVGRVDTGHPCVEVDVAGDSAVELSDCLPVIVAIAKWDVKRDTIDLTLSDKITFPQVQRAIAFWLQEESVPRTCGPSKVTYECLKEIIARWLTGTPICEPLPGSAPSICGDCGEDH